MEKHIHRSDNIPIEVIKEKVSIASKVSVFDMEIPNKWPGSRKREVSDARHISMALSKDLSKMSLAVIGRNHGQRDHATVLHAHKTIEELLDTKNIWITDVYTKSKQLIDDWLDRKNGKNPLMKPFLSRKEKATFVKTWINNKVPLYIRQQILESVGKKCQLCGNHLNNLKNGNRVKTVSNSLQRSYKKQI